MSPPRHGSRSYDDVFFQAQRALSESSAAAVLPHVLEAIPLDSVLDIGCGIGTWLAVYARLGVPDVCGVDGDYVNRAMLLVDEQRFVSRDITEPFDLHREFALVQCLEVAEHIPPRSSEQLINNIVRHGKLVLFSAAVPGQGGTDHINERPLESWRRLFRARGYQLFDFVRPLIQHNRQIASWYRYNVLFFAHDGVVDSLPAVVKDAHVPDDASIVDYSPLPFRIRKAVLRPLPVWAVSILSRIKQRVFLKKAG